MAKDLFELAISGAHRQEPWSNILHIEGDNLVIADKIENAEDLVNEFDANILANYLAMLPSSTQVLRLTAKSTSGQRDPAFVKQYQFGSMPGTVSGGAQSNQLCPIVRLIPPTGTKSAGRFFLPAIAEADIGNNTPITSWLTRLATMMGLLLAGFGGGGITWTIAIRSRKLDSYTLAQDYDTSPIIGWQRRRQRPY